MLCKINKFKTTKWELAIFLIKGQRVNNYRLCRLHIICDIFFRFSLFFFLNLKEC